MSIFLYGKCAKLVSLLLTGGLCLAVLANAPTTAAAGPALVQVIDSSIWPKPSPDPAGITYWPAHDTLVVADSEIDEMSIFDGANVFESTRAGVQVQTYDISKLNNEPAGIDIDVAPNGHFFISNDSAKKIYDFDLGPDRRLGTGDDIVRVFLTSAFGNTDPEGLTIGPGGKIYTVDGSGQEVYATDPGSGGRFGDGNDTTTHFDVAVLGIQDPEGVDYNPASGTLYIADRKTTKVWEVTTAGALVRSIDVHALVASARDLGDLTLAPSSTGSGEQHLYIVDRGIDNNKDPNENDGKIYEISLGDTPPDTTSPTVTSRTPAVDATGVDVSGNVTATFDEAVTGIDDTSFTLTLPDNTPVAATVVYDTVARTAILNPDADLASDTVYTAHLTGPIADQAGNPLAALHWSFTTAGAAPANMLANPGFEIDDNADNRPDIWSSNSRFTRACGANLPPQGAHEGGCVGKFFAADNSGTTISQNIGGIVAGKTYNFVGWVNIPATADAFTFKLQVRWLNASNSTISTKTAKTYTAATNGWSQAAYSAVAPAGATSAQIRMNVSSLAATIYVDDLSFQSTQ
jgi:hypothetical protein